MQVKYVMTNIPRSIILVPGATVDVPDAVMRIARVRRALHITGRIVLA